MKNKHTSPKRSKPGCLCKDGKYRLECCDGKLQSQGIGQIFSDGTETVTTVINPDGSRTKTRN